jgi:hypothetical protein
MKFAQIDTKEQGVASWHRLTADRDYLVIYENHDWWEFYFLNDKGHVVSIKTTRLKPGKTVYV